MDYAYDETSDVLGRGGGAIVYRARRPGDGLVVALKRPLPFPQCNDRLRREISVLSALSHPHVMPVLDSGIDTQGEHWYAMPLARGSLKRLWESGHLGNDVDAIGFEVLEQVSLGLGAMHDANFLHRDVNPNNILALDDPTQPNGYRWVVADCGLVRRPLGHTTQVLTETGARLGTEGYIAPEAFTDAHAVAEAADIYSLGRVLAWLTTGTTPVLTVQLLPEGRWRPAVRELTYEEAPRRPQNMADALARSVELAVDLPVSDKAQFRLDLQEKGGAISADDALWDVTTEQMDDYDFMVDDVVEIKDKSVRAFAKARPANAARLGERMARHLMEGSWGSRRFDDANANLNWIHSVLEGLDDIGRHDLLEDVAVPYCRAVAGVHRFAHNDILNGWLRDLDEAPARAMARAIHQSGDLEYFRREFGHARFRSSALTALLER